MSESNGVHKYSRWMMAVTASLGALISAGTIWMAVAQPALVSLIDSQIIRHVGSVQESLTEIRKMVIETRIDQHTREQRDLDSERFKLQVQVETDQNLKPEDRVKIRNRLAEITERIQRLNSITQDLRGKFDR